MISIFLIKLFLRSRLKEYLRKQILRPFTAFFHVYIYRYCCGILHNFASNTQLTLYPRYLIGINDEKSPQLSPVHNCPVWPQMSSNIIWQFYYLKSYSFVTDPTMTVSCFQGTFFYLRGLNYPDTASNRMNLLY
jgi:hypothetical protein